MFVIGTDIDVDTLLRKVFITNIIYKLKSVKTAVQ